MPSRSRSSAPPPPGCSPTGSPDSPQPAPRSPCAPSSTSGPRRPWTSTTHPKRCGRPWSCATPTASSPAAAATPGPATSTTSPSTYRWKTADRRAKPGPANLAPLCRTHHRVKTHTAWHYKRLDDGSYVWTSTHRPPVRRDPGPTADPKSLTAHHPGTPGVTGMLGSDQWFRDARFARSSTTGSGVRTLGSSVRSLRSFRDARPRSSPGTTRDARSSTTGDHSRRWCLAPRLSGTTAECRHDCLLDQLLPGDQRRGEGGGVRRAVRARRCVPPAAPSLPVGCRSRPMRPACRTAPS